MIVLMEVSPSTPLIDTAFALYTSRDARTYYITDKSGKAVWNKRQQPLPFLHAYNIEIIFLVSHRRRH